MRSRLVIRGPAGDLEALIEAPGPPPWSRVALLCHPHPLHGGTMNTTPVVRMARGLQRSAHATLRFNFRGVGASGGEHDGGRGELDDVRSALEELLARSAHPEPRVTLAGFSFGAHVGLQIGAADARVARLLGVGLPLGLYDFGFLERCPKAKLIIQGEVDELTPAALFQSFLQRVRKPCEARIVPGADHIFRRRVQEIEEIVARW